jgi:hypothetical protein
MSQQLESNKYLSKQNEIKLRGMSPQANYTKRATAACQQS